MSIRLARGLELPVDVVTQTVGILAKRRAGKSYTARRFVEQLSKAHAQIVVVDPKGDWWGVRAHRDGKQPGLPLTILGGERGDVGLEVGAGELVAQLVVEEHVSAVLDLSHFRKAELATFMASFLETLYRLKAREKNRTPMMLVIDEADAIAPQRTTEKGSVPRMLGACEDIVRRGGQRGIGCTLISQRSAVLNKNVLTQVQILVALRTIAPQDLKALDEWIDVHGSEEERKTLRASLPSLPTGDAWFWSPGWPDAEGIFKRVHIDRIDTFDSGATPKVGERAAEPKALADVDLEALRRRMAETLERQAAADPKRLRSRVRELEAALAKQQAAPAAADPDVVAAAVDAARAEAHARLAGRVREFHGMLEGALHALRKDLEKTIEAEITALIEGTRKLVAVSGFSTSVEKRKPEDPPPPPTPGRYMSGEVGATPRVRSGGTRAGAIAEGLDGPTQRILDAMAWLQAAGMPSPWKRSQVAFIAGYSPTSSAFSNPLGRLHNTLGMISYPAPGQVAFTDAGAAAAHDVEAVPTVEQLHARILERLDGPMRRILEPLLEAYPNPMAREDLAEAAGYSSTSSAFSNPLGRLRNTLELIDYPGAGFVVALPVLFLEA